MIDPSNVEPGSRVGAPTENEAASKRCSGAPGSAGRLHGFAETFLFAWVAVMTWDVLSKLGEPLEPRDQGATYGLSFFVGYVAVCIVPIALAVYVGYGLGKQDRPNI